MLIAARQLDSGRLGIAEPATHGNVSELEQRRGSEQPRRPGSVSPTCSAWTLAASQGRTATTRRTAPRRCDNPNGPRGEPPRRAVRRRDARRPPSRALPLGGECSGECSAYGCRLGADGRGDLARYGRPAWRAALARSGGRALGAAKYEAIRFVGPLLGRPAVRRGAIRERAGNYREDAPGAQPCVVMGFHAPSIGRLATIVAPDRAQRIGRGEVVESCPERPRGP